MVKGHVVADLRRFADHDAKSVVDEETPADGGTGVNFDAREQAGDIGHPARRQAPVPQPQPMGNPVAG